MARAQAFLTPEAGLRTPSPHWGVSTPPLFLAVEPGLIHLTGQDVMLRYEQTLRVQPGLIHLTGQNVTLQTTGTPASTTVHVEPASIHLTGEDVALPQSRILAVEAASIFLTGQTVVTGVGETNFWTALIPGALLVNAGPDSQITYGPSGAPFVQIWHDVGPSLALTVEAASIHLTGQNVALDAPDLTLPVEPGTIHLTGQDVTLVESGSAMPAYDSAATPTASATAAGTHQLTFPSTLAVGDEVTISFLARSLSGSIDLHSDASTLGFAVIHEDDHAPNGARLSLIARKRIAAGEQTGGGSDLSGTTINAVTVTGSGNDVALGVMQRWTAANGFDDSPVEDLITSADTTSDTVSANSVTPAGLNRLGVSIALLWDNSTGVAAFTGATGGTGAWTERNSAQTSLGTDATIQVQTIDLSGGAGDAVSGGSYTVGSNVFYRVVSWAWVPA